MMSRQVGNLRGAAMAPPRKSVIQSRSAFTLVELLVVMIVITILVSSVLVASSVLITRSRVSNTQAMLALVQQAVETFEREQKAKPTIAGVRQGGVQYPELYGHFPADELEIFTDEGLRGATGPTRSVAPREAVMVPAPTPNYKSMRFDGRFLDPADAADEHRDIAALYLSIQLFGNESKTMLDSIHPTYWRDGPRQPGGVNLPDVPALFLDRNDDAEWQALEDLEVRFLVDAWGVPISYMAQQDWDATDPPAASSNHAEWNRVSTTLIPLNDKQPIIFSWGPDGEGQLTAEAMGTNAAASLVGDFADVGANGTPDRITNPLNTDNIYANEALKAKLGG